MKGLLFKPWKAQAIHESNPDIEWQTRRRIKPQPKIIHEIFTYQEVMYVQTEMLERDKNLLNGCIKCPYSVGEQVYIKETHRIINGDGNPNDFGVEYKSGQINWWRDNGGRFNYPIDEKWRSSLFLPADLARTVVTITDIQAQRVQDISEKDAIAEGLVYNAFWDMWESPIHPGHYIDWYKSAFRLLWDSIHGEGAWLRNDFVWKYSFIRREHETTE